MSNQEEYLSRPCDIVASLCIKPMDGRGIKRTNVKFDVCACLFGHPLTFCFDWHCSSSYRSRAQLSLT
ncbi:hypothetical protein PV325_005833 [Microctonus aethiopoides]|nr:hypothetical protein PV325_005833 [Microctonus aethiopoides]KAK0096624.1 hypothetical protein PV326_004951 [Microctonus aethiopoides]